MTRRHYSQVKGSKLPAMSISNKNLKSAYTALRAASLVTAVKFRQKVIRWFPCCVLPVSHDVWLLFPNADSFHKFHLSLDKSQNYIPHRQQWPTNQKYNIWLFHWNLTFKLQNLKLTLYHNINATYVTDFFVSLVQLL